MLLQSYVADRMNIERQIDLYQASEQSRANRIDVGSTGHGSVARVLTAVGRVRGVSRPVAWLTTSFAGR